MITGVQFKTSDIWMIHFAEPIIWTDYSVFFKKNITEQIYEQFTLYISKQNTKQIIE